MYIYIKSLENLPVSDKTKSTANGGPPFYLTPPRTPHSFSSLKGKNGITIDIMDLINLKFYI